MQLRHINLDRSVGDSHISSESKLLALKNTDGSSEATLFDVDNLTVAAVGLFLGLCPVCSPYFIWSNSYPLPWMERYFRYEEDMAIPQKIDLEVASIINDLRDFASKNERAQFPEELPALTFSIDAYKTDQQQVQGLVVEALLAFDELIEQLVQGKPYGALRWLSAGYKFLMEAVHQALPIAEKSATARVKGLNGGKARSKKYAQLIDWALANEARYPGNPTMKARAMMAKLPAELAMLSDDPERMMREAIRKKQGEKNTGSRLRVACDRLAAASGRA